MKFLGRITAAVAVVVLAILGLAQAAPQRGTNNRFAFGLDTSDGRFVKFDGPVKGIPAGHGGGRWGAADCLLCPRGF